ncbi:type III secretion system effector protein OrgC [Salmonella enterica subsp. salamae]|nr:type III secretion system effector protein OrgC [Salmonella enterica subsp. salamae]ECJ2281846.1 type III secretion system effector protein OrgC [Salmonella enterica subsp. salamae]HCC0888678.1 type III secretion system effector protein OrgC [Salmonella enterica]
MITTTTSYLIPRGQTEKAASSVISLNDRAAAMLGNEDSAALSNANGVDAYEAFYQKLLLLPESASSETLKDAIYQEMGTFKDPSSGDSAFVSFEQQTSMLQNMIGRAEPESHLYEALNGVLVSTMNAQSQMTSWMQEIILSGGETEESIDW